MSQGGVGPVGYTPLHPLGHTGHVTGSLYLYLYLNKMTYAKRRVLEQQAGANTRERNLPQLHSVEP